MRKPTSVAKQYSWWSRAMAGENPIVTHEPHCGYFKRRLVQGGPWVPGRIYLHQEIDEETGELTGDEVMRCEVGGKTRDPIDQWTWLCNEPIEKAEFDYLTALSAWAGQHAPDQPEANPTKKVNHNLTAIPF